MNSEGRPGKIDMWVEQGAAVDSLDLGLSFPLLDSRSSMTSRPWLVCCILCGEFWA